MRVVHLFVLVTAAGAFAAVPEARGQRRELTLVAGGNYTGVTSGTLFKSESRTGFQAGLSLRSPRSARFSFQSELLLIQRRIYGERAPSNQSPLQAGPISDAANLLYIQVPLLLRFQHGYSTERPIRPFLVLGPYVAVRMSCKRDVLEADSTRRKTDCSATPEDATPGTTPFIPPIYQAMDLGLLGAFGVEVRRFSVSFRGERSLRNLVDSGALPTSPLDNARLWTASVSVEYLLRVL
jgi:outer membrane protein with beta-barrel domain